VTDWLIDTSALVRLGDAVDGQTWAERIELGLVRVSTVTRLQIGFSARTGDELRAGLRRPPLASIPVEYLTPGIEDRVVEVQQFLADRGQHRAAAVPDLLSAVTAELASLTVLHRDKDFDLIAEVTGQQIDSGFPGSGECPRPTRESPPRAGRVASADVAGRTWSPGPRSVSAWSVTREPLPLHGLRLARQRIESR